MILNLNISCTGSVINETYETEEQSVFNEDTH